MHISLILYSILLVVCSLSGLQGQNQKTFPTEEEGAHLWAEYLELVLPDYYMISSQHFPDTEKDGDDPPGETDTFPEAIWCLHYIKPTRGTFYYPNGTEVVVFTGSFSADRKTNDYSGPDPVFQTDDTQFTQRGMFSDTNSTTPLTSGYEGLYKCVILDRTLVVGVYDNSTYNDNTGPKAGDMSFSLISPPYADPPLFNLSFIVTNGPPTDVTCTGPNSFSITQTNDDLSREVVSDGTATLVTVTVRMRVGGNYQCTVSNARVENGTINYVTATEDSSSLTVTVSDAPTDFSLTRVGTGLVHVQLSWSGSSPRYEVFYSLSGTDDIQSAGETTDTTYSVTSGLSEDETYQFFVISYGNDGNPVLPSVSSGTESVTLTLPSVNDYTFSSTSNTITLTWTEPDLIPSYGYAATRYCRRLCEKSVIDNLECTSSPPLVISGINPGSTCTISSLIGLYGVIGFALANGDVITTLSVEPTTSPENILFSSVEARSLIVSWDEVTCSGQNGPITGYLLYITNTTFSDTINITGGENRSYTVTELRPYTNYTVMVSAYNDAGIGPTSDERTQQTEQAEPGAVLNLISSRSDIDEIIITWNLPFIPNGIIIVYEIRYTVYDNGGGVFIIMNGTANTQYTINGLLPNTSYTVGVRAYTIAGPGEWTDETVMTSDIPMVQNFQVTHIDDTTVRVTWVSIESDDVEKYTVYYYGTSQVKRQVHSESKSFSADVSEGVIDGLNPNLDYKFSITVTFTLGGVEYEGEETIPSLPSDIPIMTSTSSINTITASTIATQTSSSNVDSNIGLKIGISLSCIVCVVLTCVLVIMIIFIYKKRGKHHVYDMPPSDHEMNRQDSEPVGQDYEVVNRQDSEPVAMQLEHQYEEII